MPKSTLSGSPGGWVRNCRLAFQGGSTILQSSQQHIVQSLCVLSPPASILPIPMGVSPGASMCISQMANDVEHPCIYLPSSVKAFHVFPPFSDFKKMYLCACAVVCVYMNMYIQVPEEARGHGMPWSHLIRVLGTTPWSSGRAACAPNRAFSPAPHFLMLLIFPTEFSFCLDSSLFIDYVSCRCFLPVCNYTHFFCTKVFNFNEV